MGFAESFQIRIPPIEGRPDLRRNIVSSKQSQNLFLVLMNDLLIQILTLKNRLFAEQNY